MEEQWPAGAGPERRPAQRAGAGRGPIGACLLVKRWSKQRVKRERGKAVLASLQLATTSAAKQIVGLSGKERRKAVKHDEDDLLAMTR